MLGQTERPMIALHQIKTIKSLCAMGAVMCCGVLAGCLLDAVNQPPATPVIEGPTTLSRNEKGLFTVAATDPDGHALSIVWGRQEGPCPQSLAPLGDGEWVGPSYPLTPTALGSLCVWVTVRDPQGATATGFANVKVENASPVAVFAGPAAQTTTEMALYSELRISGEASFDPDPDDTLVSFQWAVAAPNQAPQPALPCADSPAGKVLCFRPTTHGLHTITLVVADTVGLAGTATMQIMVLPDRPPCLRDTEQNTSLRLRRFDEAVAFGVAVDDDGDPFPPRVNEPSFLRFVWYVRHVTSPDAPWLPLVQFDQSAAFRLAPSAFSQGDEVQVRVEVFDRVHKDALDCSLERELCESAAGCSQRRTWTVRYWL